MTSTSPAVTSAPWYSEAAGFFGPRFLAEYASFMTSEITDRQVRCVTKLLGRVSARDILDLGCGNGRHARGLSGEGFHVIGLDLNRSMLEPHPPERGPDRLTADWVQADMRRLPFGQSFDGIVSLFTSFGLFENDDDDHLVIQQVSGSLRAGGMFILDVMNRDFVLEHFQEEETFSGDDASVCTHRRSFDPVTGHFTHGRTRVSAQGKTERWTSVVRLYTFDELRDRLSESGLTIMESYGGYEFQPISPTEPRMILAAETQS
jgi:SAM-dependent methyltransferase